MNFFKYYLLSLFLIGLSSNEILAEVDFLIEGERTKIVKSNWPTEYMSETPIIVDNSNPWEEHYDPIGAINNAGKETEDTPCIQRDASGKIQVGLSFYVADLSYMNNAADIYLRYTVANTVHIITPTEMSRTMEEGVYRFQKTVEIDLSSLTSQPRNPSSFDYNFEILTLSPNQNTYIPYPIADYPDLFVNYETVSSLNQPTHTSGTKLLCPDSFSPLSTDNTNKSITQSVQEVSFAKDKKEQDFTIDLKQKNSAFSSIKAYPNPFKNQLRIEGLYEVTLVELIDLNGQIMFSEELSSAEIPTSFLPVGIYICRVHLNDAVHYMKVVKK